MAAIGCRFRFVLPLGLVAFMAGCPAVPSNAPPADADKGDPELALSGREKGIAEARQAVAAGKLKLKEYPPLPYPPGHQEYVAGLRERGIEYEVPKRPEGVSEKEFIEEVRGWNGVMRAAIREKFGPDVLR